MSGIIRRRILVNYRVQPEAIQRLLPARFRPKLHKGFAIAGICLIRLEQVRPKGMPALLGISSENAAHRVAVVWDENGKPQEGVYIPRRDTNSLLNQLAGGRVFPGEHHAANFRIADDGNRIDFEMLSKDGEVAIKVRGNNATEISPQSCFANTVAASAFFETGSLGYSTTTKSDRLDGLRLKTASWAVSPLKLEYVHSSFFGDKNKFPTGTISFDCALLMRNLKHEWFSEPQLHL